MSHFVQHMMMFSKELQKIIFHLEKGMTTLVHLITLEEQRESILQTQRGGWQTV